jgi:tetratricopeptide (TPR) repeat protein
VIAAISLNSQTFLGHNQAAYQELRAALQLPLRRQLLIAVCDDGGLQDQLAERLEADLSPYLPSGGRNPQVRADQSPLVTLRLDVDHPDLVREVLLWLKQQRRLGGNPGLIPAFQMLGVSTLTRQSPTVQNRFLASLIRVDALLTQLDCRLLVWVPRPWLGKIQQVVPGFWRSRNGLYEFEGEPTPSAHTPTSLHPGMRVRPEGFLTHDPAMGLEAGLEMAGVQEAGTPPASLPSDWSMDWPLTDLAPPGLPMPPLAWVDLSASETPATEGLDTLGLSTEAQAPSLGIEPSLPSSFFQAKVPDTAPSPSPQFPALQRPALVLPPALAHHDQIDHLGQYIQLLYQQQAGPLTLARAHLALGQLCREHIAPGAEGLSVLEFTLEVYQRAIDGLLEGENDWCDALNDVASLYWMRAQLESQPEAMGQWLQRSVVAYQRAIAGQTGAAPSTLGRLYSNLGSVYGLLANLGDSQANLEQAVDAYTQALSYTPAAADPIGYADGQNSLGAIHWRLSQIDRPRHHLRRAIAAYQEALRYRIPQAEPQEYAMLQNNLGIAYWSLAQQEHPIPWLEQAIDAYQTALVYRTLATTPAGCAATQNNLGTAYWNLAQQQMPQPEERMLSLRQAVEAYEAALDAVEQALQQSPPEHPGFDVWATCHSAGIVHDQIALALPADQQAQREQHLQAALGHYLLAYQGWQDQPDQLDVLAEALVYSVRLHFEILGLTGQQTVLSKLPPNLLGRVLPKL